MEAIKDYLQSLLQNDIIVQSRLRIKNDTIVSVVSTCVMDEFDKLSDSSYTSDDKIYILRIVWIAARILMTDGLSNISLLTPLNEYDSLFNDCQYYTFRPAVLMMCSKMYYLCKAYNIDIPHCEFVPLDFN